jgi:hypothetical protein
MSFRGIFITIFLGTALIVAAFMINARKPRSDLMRNRWAVSGLTRDGVMPSWLTAIVSKSHCRRLAEAIARAVAGRRAPD